MQAIMGLADSAAATSVPGSALVPGPLSLFVHIMNRVHCVWRWHFMVTRVYTSPAELKKLLVGHIVQFVVGDKLLVRIGAQVTLIAVRILELGKQKVVLYRAYCEVHHALVSTYPLRVRVRLPKAGQSRLLDFLGPDQYLFVMRKKEALQQYVSRLALCVAQLFKEMFVVSMCYMDVIEAFSLSSEVGDQAVKHIFINATRLLDEMSENKQHIHAELLRHKSLIQRILVGLGTPCQADQLISAVASTLTVAEVTSNTVKNIFGRGEDFLKEGLSSVCLSFTGYQPGFLLPADPNPVRPQEV